MKRNKNKITILAGIIMFIVILAGCGKKSLTLDEILSQVYNSDMESFQASISINFADSENYTLDGKYIISQTGRDINNAVVLIEEDVNIDTFLYRDSSETYIRTISENESVYVKSDDIWYKTENTREITPSVNIIKDILSTGEVTEQNDEYIISAVTSLDNILPVANQYIYMLPLAGEVYKTRISELEPEGFEIPVKIDAVISKETGYITHLEIYQDSNTTPGRIINVIIDITSINETTVAIPDNVINNSVTIVSMGKDDVSYSDSAADDDINDGDISIETEYYDEALELTKNAFNNCKSVFLSQNSDISLTETAMYVDIAGNEIVITEYIDTGDTSDIESIKTLIGQNINNDDFTAVLDALHEKPGMDKVISVYIDIYSEKSGEILFSKKYKK